MRLHEEKVGGEGGHDDGYETLFRAAPYQLTAERDAFLELHVTPGTSWIDSETLGTEANEVNEGNNMSRVQGNEFRQSGRQESTDLLWL